MNEKETKLKDYLDEKGVRYTVFAERMGISYGTLWNIFRGEDLKLSTAWKIEKFTQGSVKMKDLVPNILK